MKRKILCMILAAACFIATGAGCAEIKETPANSTPSSISESSSEQSGGSDPSGTYSAPNQEQNESSSESSSVTSVPESSSSSSSSSIPVSSSVEASSSKPDSSSSSAPSSAVVPVSSSKPASSSKPVSSSKPASSSIPVSSSKPASSSIPVSSSKPASSSVKPQSSVRNEQNPPQNPQIIGNYNQRAPEQWEIEFANEVFRLTNIERVKAGLPEFKKMELLDKAAQLRTWECLVAYNHTRPNGSDFFTALTEAGIKYKGCAENIAAGQKTPQDVVNAWMKSPGHYANIMNADYVYLGVGFYYDYNNESSTPQYDYFWAQNFCK